VSLETIGFVIEVIGIPFLRKRTTCTMAGRAYLGLNNIYIYMSWNKKFKNSNSKSAVILDGSLQNAGMTIMLILKGIQMYSNKTTIWQRIDHVVLKIRCTNYVHCRKFVEQALM
jgi:hypothetical protein